MKEYIKVLESIKQQFESALDDGQNSTDIDAIEAVGDNELTIEALNMATQALIDFPAMLNQYLGENDQMIIGKDVYEELKYEVGEYDELMRQYKHLRKYASDLETKLSVEPQGEAISREAVVKALEDVKAFIAKDIIFYDLTERDKLNEFINRKIKEIEHE